MSSSTPPKRPEPLNPPDNFLKISLGWDNILILPLDDGLKFIECFAKAQKFTSEYDNGRTIPYIGGPLPQVAMELVSGAQYMEGKLNGPKQPK